MHFGGGQHQINRPTSNKQVDYSATEAMALWPDRDYREGKKVKERSLIYSTIEPHHALREKCYICVITGDVLV